MVQIHLSMGSNNTLLVQTTLSPFSKIFANSIPFSQFKRLFLFFNSINCFFSFKLFSKQLSFFSQKNYYNQFLSSQTKSLMHLNYDQNQLTSKHFLDTIITLFPKNNQHSFSTMNYETIIFSLHYENT